MSAFLDMNVRNCACRRAIIENSLREQDDSKNELTGEPEYTIKIIKPLPGFFLKAKEIETGIKVFVNICQTHEIPPPEDINENRLIDFLNSYNPSSYEVPMSIGEIQPEIDNQGNGAKKIDIAISSKFYTKMETNSMFQSFLVALALQKVTEKYQLPLDLITTLKNRKTYGELQLHRIKQHKIAEEMGASKFQQKSPIEEMEGTSSQANGNAS